MIETGSRWLDVATVVLDQIEMVPQDVGASHTPTADHENDRQHDGLEACTWARGCGHHC